MNIIYYQVLLYYYNCIKHSKIVLYIHKLRQIYIVYSSTYINLKAPLESYWELFQLAKLIG